MQSELAKQFGIEELDTLPFIEQDLLQGVPYPFAKKHLLLPFAEKEGEVLVAIADPLNLEAVDELQLLLGRPVHPFYYPEEPLLEMLETCYREGSSSASEILAHMDEERDSEGSAAQIESYDLLEQESQAPVIQLINVILTEAIEQGASDIHFEPLENDLRVRYRIDGVLITRHSPAREHQAQLLSRLKVMARLDIAEHRLPQDGRIKLRLGTREIDLRVSTLPVAGGERIVLRILDRGNVVLGLNHLGFDHEVLQTLRDLISLPEGILLVTGPTGSGKTTTLYSALTELASDEVNIITVEDPVEYKLSSIAQIGVRPKIGLTFAAGLRHILRQDPDVIMVGEIRDKETAEIAIQSALTGHLVLSTLHTNDAPSAITRLIDMGIEPYLLSSSVVGVLAQRLVRTICGKCAGSGCNHCFGSGFKGRRGIYELLPITDRIKQQIVASGDAIELRRLALKEGMATLAHQGEELVRAGITTRTEVLRVTRGLD